MPQEEGLPKEEQEKNSNISKENALVYDIRDEQQTNNASSEIITEQPTHSPKVNTTQANIAIATDLDNLKDLHSISLDDNKQISASRDSSLNIDDPKSLGDYSISAASSKQNWSVGKGDDDPSISSIKGDSVSATIADFNRKHRAQQQQQQYRQAGIDDRQSNARFTAQSVSSVDENMSGKFVDDLSTNVNFYGPGGPSTSGYHHHRHSSNSKPNDFVSLNSSSVANADGFDIIEESSNVSSWEGLSRSTSNNNTTSNDISAYVTEENMRVSGDKRSRRHYHNRRHQKKHSRRKEPRTLEQALEIDNLPQETTGYQIEPIILRGNGNMMLFGLSNSFSSEFPSALIGRVSREEFDRTMKRANSLLQEQQSLSAKLLLLGSLCCCCSFGFSLVWPSIALKKRSKMSLEKFLASENSRLYAKLGLNWKLSEQRCYSNHAFVEHVLMIEFLPKQNLYLPD